jgi:hypothetical protein
METTAAVPSTSESVNAIKALEAKLYLLEKENNQYKLNSVKRKPNKLRGCNDVYASLRRLHEITVSHENFIRKAKEKNWSNPKTLPIHTDLYAFFLDSEDRFKSTFQAHIAAAPSEEAIYSKKRTKRASSESPSKKQKTDDED